MAMFYFKCLSNKKAAVMPFDNLWEAQEMRKHPDYIEVDVDGNPIIREEDVAPNRIPFQMAGAKR